MLEEVDQSSLETEHDQESTHTEQKSTHTQQKSTHTEQKSTHTEQKSTHTEQKSTHTEQNPLDPIQNSHPSDVQFQNSNQIHNQNQQNLIEEPSLMTLFKQTVFVTKQRIMETLTNEKGSVDPEMQHKIDKLNATAADYTNLTQLSTRICEDFKQYATTQRSFGNHLYEIGIKEEREIGEMLQDIGTLHRALEKESVPLLKSTSDLISSIKTFRCAAVEDTLINLDKYTGIRQEYDGAMLLLKNLQAGKSNQEDVNEAQKLADLHKRVMDKCSEDLTVKIDILNQKRIQILETQLKLYMDSLKQYYNQGAKMLLDFKLPDKRETPTSEFVNVLGE